MFSTTLARRTVLVLHPVTWILLPLVLVPFSAVWAIAVVILASLIMTSACLALARRSEGGGGYPRQGTRRPHLLFGRNLLISLGLFAVLYPGFRSERARVERASCEARVLQQIAATARAFAEANGGRWPNHLQELHLPAGYLIDAAADDGANYVVSHVDPACGSDKLKVRYDAPAYEDHGRQAVLGTRDPIPGIGYITCTQDGRVVWAASGSLGRIGSSSSNITITTTTAPLTGSRTPTP